MKCTIIEFFYHLIIQAVFVYQDAVSIKEPFSPEDGDTVLDETLVHRQPHYTT
jgi:hypothetical protein